MGLPAAHGVGFIHTTGGHPPILEPRCGTCFSCLPSSDWPASRLGVLNVMQGSSGPHGVPFGYENYGGPGAMIAGALMFAVSLYLRSIWQERR